MGSWLFSSSPCRLSSCEFRTHPGAQVWCTCDGLFARPRTRFNDKAFDPPERVSKLHENRAGFVAEHPPKTELNAFRNAVKTGWVL